MKYDCLLKNGLVVDYGSDLEGVMDVAIKDGKIARIDSEIAAEQAEDVIDLEGYHVMPGLVDIHTHVSAWIGGKFGHKMLAKAGVTTTLDMAGPMESVLEIAQSHGAGLNIASIEYVRPQYTVRDTDPQDGELKDLLAAVLKRGSLGIKILGGHYPLTPAATARAIAAANDQKAYVAFHCGTLDKGSNIEGLCEAVELAQGHSLHIAHINSYVRGTVRDSWLETADAVELLLANPNIRSESYLSPLNGTSAKCTDGRPDSAATRKCLEMGGFQPTKAGLEQAIVQGWAQINMEAGGQVVLAVGRDAAEYWRARGTDTTVSFQVNPPAPRVRLAAARRADNRFVVDCISTDGGGIPRNTILEMGLSLVKLQMLTLKDFVRKCSYTPSRILGLKDKGHLKPGADADITVVDYGRQRPYMSMVEGKVIMMDGYVCGKGSVIVTTADGQAHVREKGLRPLVVDIAGGAFYNPID